MQEQVTGSGQVESVRHDEHHNLWTNRVTSLRVILPNRGIGSSDFRRAPLSAQLALAAVLTVPLQQAGTVDVGFPLKLSEIFMGLAVVSAIVRGIRARTLKFRWSVDEICVSFIALCLVVSTLIAVTSADLSASIPGVSRSAVLDLALYTVYGAFVLAAWWTLRLVDARLIRDVLMQSLWLCFIAVCMQLAVRLTDNGRSFLESLGFAMDRWGAQIGDVTTLRNGPFLEGQQLGFYAGAMLVIALYSRRYVTGVAALVCVAWSLSTTAFLATVVAIVIATVVRPTRGSLITAASLATAAALLVSFVTPLRDALILQLAKLNLFGFGTERAMVSLDVRSAKTEIGWRMMWDYPWGVGSGRYGAVFLNYQSDYPQIPNRVLEEKARAIAENVYVQIGSELGLIAFCAFLLLITWLIFKSWRGSRLGIAVCAFVAVGAVTQSSWTFIPLWVLLAFGSSLVRQRKESGADRDIDFSMSRREARRRVGSI